ncbi:MAG: GatB/YqeY domain-containing protein [bacterium]|nr:GatB/YqeY domain-containing protein [bacterium]
MAMLERIQGDLVRAMKAKEAQRVSVLRMLKAALDDAAREAMTAGKEFSDDAAVARMQTEAKRLRDAMAEFRAGGRDDLADTAVAEIAIIGQYLPVQMAEDAIRAVVMAKRTEMGETDLGPLMSVVMAELKGKADGGTVRRIVSEVLAS